MFTVPKFAVPTPQDGSTRNHPTTSLALVAECAGKTHQCFRPSPTTSAAICRKRSNVPVGIIHTSWGGTPAQAWTSREVLAADPGLKYYVDDLETRRKNWDPNKVKAQHEEAMAKWKVAAEEAKTNNKPVHVSRACLASRHRPERRLDALQRHDPSALAYAIKAASGIRASQTPANPSNTGRSTRR